MIKPIIYVLSVYYYTSGGAETLHQLVDRLRSLGKDAKIFYVDNDEADKQPDKFKDYNIFVTHEIEDSESNIMIVPETKTEYFFAYKKIRKVVWWLSLNFYLYNYPNTHAQIIAKRFMLPTLSIPIVSFLLACKQRKQRYLAFNKDNINEFYHLYNCEYARQYISNLGVKEEKTVYLCGPLNKTYFELYKNVDIKEKRDIILYNPRKGRFFINSLIKYAKNRGCTADFIALENMTTQEVYNTISHAKLFVDFGEFPGPERIPRESVLLKCNLITSRNGSADNNIDVPIPDEYKFEYKRENIPNVYCKLVDMLENYEKHIPNFDNYRNKVLNQPKLFEDGIEKLVQICEESNC